jgi:hypothetical protein
LPGAVARRDQSQSVSSSARPMYFHPARRLAFCPDGSPSCALFGGREAAVLAMLSETVRSIRRRFPLSCAPPTFSASPSARPSVGCVNRGRLRHGYMHSFQPLRGGSPDRTAPGHRSDRGRWSVRANARRNSHCAPTARDAVRSTNGTEFSREMGFGGREFESRPPNH